MPGVTASLRSSSAGCVGVTEQVPVRVTAELLQNQTSPSEVLQRPASPCHTNTLKSYIQENNCMFNNISNVYQQYENIHYRCIKTIEYYGKVLYFFVI